MTGGYDGLRAYKASKLANVLFTRELARRWEPLGVPDLRPRVPSRSRGHVLRR
jgi:NAD(P)-dependent dehydrogenase (short-subunit alcohol dehydrogenase family)